MCGDESFQIAGVQACPVYLDLDSTIEKACALIAEVGRAGAKLAVFPEAFVSGYPLWVWFIPPAQTHPLRELYAELHRNAVSIPGQTTDRLCAAARDAGVAVAIGVNERNIEASDSTIYNTLLYIGPDGSILGKHRKLVPTAGERLVWGQGDGSDLEVYELPFGRLGGLLCWENYMPLARHALSAWGIQIHAAPTWDRGEPWLSTMRHIAKESRSFVVGCCSPMRFEDIPNRLEFKGEYLAGKKGWLNPGDSVIVDPDGKVVAGPAREEETILYASVQPEQLIGPRWQLDVAGHYGRPDVFELRVHRHPLSQLHVVDSAGEEASESEQDRAPTSASPVTLREINKDTVRDFCALSVREDQKQFVAPNAVSIAQAYFEKKAWFRGVYADENPVGFVMLSDDSEKPEYYLWRFMIDSRYQGMDFGRRALQMVADHVRSRPNATELLTSVVQAEGGPQEFYEKQGFELTGEYEEGEAVMRLRL